MRPGRGVRAALSFLWWEAVFAMAYETWVGSSYVTGLAGEAGVSVGLVAILTALPGIGSVGQLAGVIAFERVRSVRRYTLGLAIAARSLWLIPLVLALYWGHRSWVGGAPFPRDPWFLVLSGVAAVVTLLGQMSAVSWLTWMKGLVPRAMEGRFFGIRQRHVMAGLIVANLLASVLIAWNPRGFRVGYAVVCALAITAAAISTCLLSKVPDVAAREPAREPFQWSRFLEPLRNKEFMRVVIFAAGFNGAISIAGPYFAYYFTKELHISMSSVAIWAILTNIGAFLASASWGKRIDRKGDPRQTLYWGAHLMAVSPLPYLVPSAEMIRLIAPVEFFVNGIAWSAYSISLQQLFFRVCPAERSLIYFSVYTAIWGLSGALFSFAGGHLAKALVAAGGFRALWVLATALRLGVLWASIPMIRKVRTRAS